MTDTHPSATTPAAALLVLPGWDDDGRSQYERLERDLAPRGWACSRADLPDASWPDAARHAATREQNLRQTLQDHDALVSRASAAAIGALGFSYGGYMAALLAARRRLDALVLRCPALYPDDDWLCPKEELDKRELDDYRSRVHAPSTNRALAACAGFQGDVLLVSCEHDEVIPPPVIESYAQALACRARSVTRHVLRGADHELSEQRWQDDYHALVVDWLEPIRRHGNGRAG
ncbi:MAG: prolyl oligopeptidase family serine peptidase [Burkholderiaceae bacterium]|nr:prolyl oligopeptidase family serine peptidase [Burkholderiaceae bacterium]